MKVKRDPWIRFWKHVNKAGPVVSAALGPCWTWLRATDRDGYGWFKHAGRLVYAHRFALNQPSGLVLHRCDNPSCVRPEHLFVGSNLDNMRDKQKKGRCSALRGERSHLAKLTAEQVQEIRVAPGTQREIAARFGIGQAQVSRIRLGQRWGAPKPSTRNHPAGDP